MRPLNTLATTLLATILVVGLGACGKKKNGSAPAAATPAAATPGSACIFNPQLGRYLNTANQECNPNATQTTCPANGIYTNQHGQQATCTPGQLVTTGGLNYPGQYPNGQFQNQTGGCDAYYQQYGTWYVPAVVSGQLMCVRYDLVNTQAVANTPYYNNMDYYYAYPPEYSNNSSGYCIGFFGISYCSY